MRKINIKMNSKSSLYRKERTKFEVFIPATLILIAMLMTFYASSFQKTGVIMFDKLLLSILAFIWIIVMQPMWELSFRVYIFTTAGLSLIFVSLYSEFLSGAYNVPILLAIPKFMLPLGLLILIYGMYEAIKERRRAIHELKRNIEQRDLYIDILTHDIANPLTVVKNILKDLEGEGKDIAMRNVEKISDIIENMKFFSKIISIENHVEKKEINLSDLINNVIKMFSNRLKEKNIKIEFYQENKDVIINACNFIENVFANLIDNAIKYSPEGSTIRIKVSDFGDRVVVSIADEGIGIPDKYKRRIFERFERGCKEGIKGTGLGLAIAKRIVEIHNGRIWVEDNNPKGSIFYVELPKH